MQQTITPQQDAPPCSSQPRQSVAMHLPWAIMLLVILSPLDPYRIPLLGLSWSPQRLFLLVYFPVFLANSLFSKRLALRPPHLFAFGVLLSILFSMLGSDVDYALFRKYAIIDVFNVIMFWMIYQVASQSLSNRKAILRAFLIFACIYLAYAAYTGLMLWVFRTPITEPPLIDRLPFFVSDDESRLERMYNLRRFCLPFGVPQALGIVVGLLSFLFSAQSVSDRSGKWGAMTSALLLVMVLTFSRSAILAVVFGYGFIIWNTIFQPNRIGKIIRRIVAFVTVAIFSLSILIFMLSERGFTIPLMRIFEFSDLENSSHMEIRLIALKAWLEQDFVEMLFGIGVGNFSRVGEAWRAHMTYANILVERGLIGLIASCTMFGILPIAFRHRYRFSGRTEDRIWFGASLAIFMAHILYAFFSYTALWMIYAYLCAEAWPRMRHARGAIRGEIITN